MRIPGGSAVQSSCTICSPCSSSLCIDAHPRRMSPNSHITSAREPKSRQRRRNNEMEASSASENASASKTCSPAKSSTPVRAESHLIEEWFYSQSARWHVSVLYTVVLSVMLMLGLCRSPGQPIATPSCISIAIPGPTAHSRSHKSHIRSAWLERTLSYCVLNDTRHRAKCETRIHDHLTRPKIKLKQLI